MAKFTEKTQIRMDGRGTKTKERINEKMVGKSYGGTTSRKGTKADKPNVGVLADARSSDEMIAELRANSIKAYHEECDAFYRKFGKMRMTWEFKNRDYARVRNMPNLSFEK